MTEKHQANAAPQVTLAEIGALLKEGREKAGFTKADVSNRTKIAMEQIDCLEEGRQPQIAGVYARGFLRTYCELLKVSEPETIVEAYRSLTAVADDDFRKPITSKYSSQKGLNEPRSRGMGILVIVLLFLAGFVAAVLISSQFRQSLYDLMPDSLRPMPAAPPASGEAGNNPTTSNEPVRNADGTVIFQAPVSGPAGNETYSGRLTLRAERPAWAQISVDDGPIGMVFFEAGQAQSFEGLNNIRVIAGDGQALRMEWNGQDRGFLGQEGPVELFFALTKPEPQT
ncbi:MAG: DUF4115 domain-containing protein [Deltaproteobacteria bacterium]|nr:DUF4115 domain-containing protein [Deltaproteobacteria bacterium]